MFMAGTGKEELLVGLKKTLGIAGYVYLVEYDSGFTIIPILKLIQLYHLNK